jgi:hypothetical protein
MSSLLSQTELDKAGDWHFAWWLTVANMPAKEATRWQKRATWADHRLERARRECLRLQICCYYCERSGHDETERSCPDRQMDAQRFVATGRQWRRKEGA